MCGQAVGRRRKTRSARQKRHKPAPQKREFRIFKRCVRERRTGSTRRSQDQGRSTIDPETREPPRPNRDGSSGRSCASCRRRSDGPVARCCFSNDSSGYVQVSLYVYSPSDPYVIEIGSAPNQVDAYGAFVPVVTVARAGDLRAPSSGNALIWRSSSPLVAGTYYIHAAQDRTASFIQYQVQLCAILGCFPSFPADFRYYEWSPTMAFNVTYPCIVPRVIGATVAYASAQLRGARCALGPMRRIYSRTFRKGRVISQSPSAGSQLPNGAPVSLVISRGKRR